MIQGWLLAALLVQFAETPLEGLLAAGWAALPGSPEAELRCTLYSRDYWFVEVIDGRIKARPELRAPRRLDRLPFELPEERDRSGDRHVLRVSDGWIVGFNDGEFGGGLWWFSPLGHDAIRIRPPADAPIHPDDIFAAENVLGFVSVDGKSLVLMGLDHLTGRSGRIFRLVRDSIGWALSPVAVLDSQPDAWVVERTRMLIVTGGGIWTMQANGDLERIYALGPLDVRIIDPASGMLVTTWRVDLGNLAPTSVARGADGSLYLGLRHYVLRLEHGESGWIETWLVRSDCTKVRAGAHEWECVCVE